MENLSRNAREYTIFTSDKKRLKEAENRKQRIYLGFSNSEGQRVKLQSPKILTTI